MMLLAVLLQIDLHGGSGSGTLGIRSKVTNPLVENIDAIYAFVMICLLLYALIISHRIFTKWQMGDENAFQMIYKWFSGLLIVFMMLTFLRAYIKTRNFGGATTPDVPVTELTPSQKDGIVVPNNLQCMPFADSRSSGHRWV